LGGVFSFLSSTFSQTDDEFGEKTVSILLDGEESEMIFIDHPTVEMSVSIIYFTDLLNSCF
jgi:hypothetical protein